MRKLVVQTLANSFNASKSGLEIVKDRLQKLGWFASEEGYWLALDIEGIAVYGVETKPENLPYYANWFYNDRLDLHMVIIPWSHLETWLSLI